MSQPHPLVSAKWLLDNSQAPDLRIVDATWFAPFTNPPLTGRQAYYQGHIPSAVFFDIDEITDPDSPLPHTFPSQPVFASCLGKLGIGHEQRIVVYDQNNFYASARVWWMFRAMGASDVLVLDGGLKTWTAAGGTLSDRTPRISGHSFTPSLQTKLIKTKKQIAAMTGASARHILDARPSGRFNGTSPEPREGLPSGHIPGSVNLPASDLLEAGSMKSAEKLRAVFDQADIDPAQIAVTSCGSGVAAAVTILALATLGHEHVALYDGSWTDYALDGELPLETGDPA